MILEEETYRKFGYYPHDLAPKSTKKVICSCDSCNKIRTLSKQKAHNICKSCSMVGRHVTDATKTKISNSLKKQKVKCICKQCGENFSVIPSFLGQGKGIFCSMECYRNYQRKDKVVRVCPICGKEFRTSKSLLEKGWGKFCSHICHGKWKSQDPAYVKFLRGIGQSIRSPTQPELIFKRICEKNSLPFHYTGDGQLWIGKKKKLNPDFIEANGKKICIEIFGDYWHSPLLNKKIPESGILTYRKAHYRRFKWIPFFIWESDLKRKDAEQFVLTALQKEGLIK